MAILTAHERATLELLADGWTRERIMRHRGTAHGPLGRTVKRIITKLEATNTAHAVHLAHNAGILKPPPDHGTESAYRRHIRHGETPCQPCRDALAAVRRQQRAARKADAC